MKLSIIVAMTKDMVIGLNGGMPWRLPEDLKLFKKTTLNHPIIMGRKTYESIGFPLKDRTNIVLSSKKLEISGCVVVNSFKQAIEESKKTGADECFVIGGGILYKQFLPMATKLYISLVSGNYKGDTYFPNFDKSQWKKVSAQKKEGFVFSIFSRQNTETHNFDHTRSPEQKAVMEKAEENGVCPFCWDYLLKHHTKPILKQTTFWCLAENGWPYKGTETHLIFLYKDHVSCLSEVEPAALAELPKLIKWAKKEYKIKGGGFFIRFGKMSCTGSSVQHIHAQLVVGNSEKGVGSEALRVKLGYKKIE